MKRHPFDDPVAEKLAWWMDSAIRIGPVSIGLDGLIGLIPGLGDLLSDLVGIVIVLRAMQNGAHRAAVLRMLLNLGIDSLVGSVPVLGDIFDFAYKANTRNLRIYRESLGGLRNPRRDWGFIVLVAVLVIILLSAAIALPILGLLYIFQSVTSWLL
jgi:hypothetical protein